MEFKERFKEALNYLAETDLAAMEPGRYDINEDFYILRQSYESKPSEICRFETHQKYVDIQWIIEGEEAIEVTDVASVEVDEVYDPQKDAQFYKTPERPASHVVVKAGSYMTLFPEVVHRAGLAEGKSVHVEKVVAKVRL